MNSAGYRRSWRSSAPSALEVDLEPGAELSATKHAIEQALQVQTTHDAGFTRTPSRGPSWSG